MKQVLMREPQKSEIQRRCYENETGISVMWPQILATSINQNWQGMATSLELPEGTSPTNTLTGTNPVILNLNFYLQSCKILS
jgi:hypothetical protein